MNIGDVVIPRRLTWEETQHGVVKAHLACGSGFYTHAICVDTEPFVLVSDQGDMKWTCVEENKFTSLCQAHPDVVGRAMARYQRDFMEEQFSLRKNSHDG